MAIKLALRGAVGVLGLGVAALLLSAFGLESWRFSAGSIITFRIVLGVALAALIGWFLLRPLLRRVSDEQVALYLEEHEPSLQAAIISAVEMSAVNAASTTESPHSAALVERLVESAVEKCQAIDRGRAVERRAGAALRRDHRGDCRRDAGRVLTRARHTCGTRCRRC